MLPNDESRTIVPLHSKTLPNDAGLAKDASAMTADSAPRAPETAPADASDSQTTTADAVDAGSQDAAISDAVAPALAISDAAWSDVAFSDTLSPDSVSSERPGGSTSDLDDAGLPITTADVAYMAVWASGANDVWVGGKGGRTAGPLQHWDGTTWMDFSAFPSSCLVQEIWGARPTSVWAVGCTKTIMHWDGATWREQSSPAQDLLLALRGSADDDVWAGGWGGLLLHWDGQAWATVSSGTSRAIDRFWVNGRSDAWLVAGSGSSTEVRHWDGASWATSSMVDVGIGQQPTSIFALTGDDIWLSSWAGLHHFDGMTWAVPPAGKDIGTGTVFALWGTSAKQIYAASFQAWRFDGTGWTVIPTETGTVRGVWGIASGEAWFVGDNGYLGTYQP
jgi:hypothetical protein